MSAAGGVAARAAAAAQVLVADPADPELAPGDARHLAAVLRLRPGEQVVAADGRGRWCLCRYRGADAGDGPHRGAQGALVPEGPVQVEPPPSRRVTVAFAPAKGERAEWVVQKLTELGVDRLVPLATRRSVVRWDGERAPRAIARLRRVAAEASCQSRRVWLPQIDEVRTLAELVAGAGTAEGPGAVTLAQLGGDPLPPGAVTVAVGPEGGWAPEELALGCPTVGLGPQVLRSETAAIAAGVLLCAHRAGTVVGTRPG